MKTYITGSNSTKIPLQNIKQMEPQQKGTSRQRSRKYRRYIKLLGAISFFSCDSEIVTIPTVFFYEPKTDIHVLTSRSSKNCA